MFKPSSIYIVNVWCYAQNVYISIVAVILAFVLDIIMIMQILTYDGAGDNVICISQYKY